MLCIKCIVWLCIFIVIVISTEYNDYDKRHRCVRRIWAVLRFSKITSDMKSVAIIVGPGSWPTPGPWEPPSPAPAPGPPWAVAPPAPRTMRSVSRPGPGSWRRPSSLSRSWSPDVSVLPLPGHAPGDHHHEAKLFKLLPRRLLTDKCGLTTRQ